MSATTSHAAPLDRVPGSLPPSLEAEAIAEAAGRLGARLAEAKTALGRVVFGQERVIDQALTAIVADGHMLLVGVPGLAKTRLVEALGTTLGLSERRIQCTPDLMPADILGSEVLDQDEAGRRAFRFIEGPVFAQMLMADEINRASPRTQSALLQAMQERVVTVAGQPRALPRPFHVLATQNPIEQEGTYPLPEAQLDRFLLRINIDYPDREAERRVILETTGVTDERARRILSAQELLEAQQTARRLPVGERVVETILTLVRAGRPEESPLPEVRTHVAWGPGPRASQALVLASRARALIDGRLSPSLDDVVALARPVLEHRMALTFGARADGITVDQVVKRLVDHALSAAA